MENSNIRGRSPLVTLQNQPNIRNQRQIHNSNPIAQINVYKIMDFNNYSICISCNCLDFSQPQNKIFYRGESGLIHFDLELFISNAGQRE